MDLHYVRKLNSVSSTICRSTADQKVKQGFAIMHPLPSMSSLSPANTTDKASSITVISSNSLATRIARNLCSAAAKLLGPFLFPALLFVLFILPVSGHGSGARLFHPIHRHTQVLP